MSEHHASSPPAASDTSLLGALPGLVRVVGSASWRIASWTFSTSAANGTRLAKALASGEPPTKVVAEVTSALRATLVEVLGLSTSVERSTANLQRGASPDELRARGAALLHASADVWFEADTHPAYARILDELTPDEARILRLLTLEGPQPSVDVRTSRPLGVGSELIAGGLSMIGLRAGVRSINQTQANLNNLHRLGLIWFSREQVADPTAYQVVEVQPDVSEAKKQAGRSSKVVHRSIQMTPFGEDFCATCLPAPTGNGNTGFGH